MVTTLSLRMVVIGTLIGFAMPIAPAGAGAATVPPGYRLDAPIEGVHQPTALAFAPGGDVFVAERNGRVKVFRGVNDPAGDLVLDITAEVHASHDRGLLGMALDPDYPAEPYLYLTYSYDAPPGETAPVHEQGPEGDDNCVLLATGEEDCLASGRVSRVELDPETGQALGGTEPLLTDWCGQVTAHSMGDLEFDGEGALLVGGGDGAHFATPDYGQFGNPCKDPLHEGGSLRAQDLRTQADPTGYNGSIIRIDPETGEPWPDNPGIGSADAEARRIVAYGLRNPFRLALRPGTTELYIGDVGSKYFEELNLLPDPATQPHGIANFGWPCFESPARTPGFDALAFDVPLPLCRSLYQAAPANLTSPYFFYRRGGPLFGADECDYGTGAATSGLAFYKAPAEPLPGAPEELEGSLLLADAARGCLWEMRPGAEGRPRASGLRNLVVSESPDEGAFVPVNVVVGPDGAVYMPNFYRDEVSRLRRFVGNQPPKAELLANRTSGLMEAGEFPVEFDATGSTDAEDSDELTYEWDLDGDGTFEPGPATNSRVYTEEENVTAQLRVIDPDGVADIDRVKLYPGDRPPQDLVMELPPEHPSPWTVGERIALAGSASDPDEASGDEVQLDWDVLLRHCPDRCHSHPFERFADTATAEVTAPDHEYPSHLLVRLTATDRRGLSIEVQREVHPRSVEVRLESEPPGVRLTIGTETRESPFEQTLIAGGAATVSAPRTATLGDTQYRFSSWSDGGERTHLIEHAESGRLVARYAPVVPLLAPALALAPRTVKLRFVSRPGGLPLRVGRRWQRAPFSRRLRPGQRTAIAAPRRLRRRGRLFEFSHWTHSRRRVNRVTATRPRIYVAVFSSRPIVRDGLVQALSWRRRAR